MPRDERDDRIDDRIGEWHDAPEGTLDGPVHEALGWTWDEYVIYIETGTPPLEREGSY